LRWHPLKQSMRWTFFQPCAFLSLNKSNFSFLMCSLYGQQHTHYQPCFCSSWCFLDHFTSKTIEFGEVNCATQQVCCLVPLFASWLSFLIHSYPFKWHQGFGHSIWLPFLHFVLTLGSLKCVT
jgi:hypothetical protein